MLLGPHSLIAQSLHTHESSSRGGSSRQCVLAASGLLALTDATNASNLATGCLPTERLHSLSNLAQVILVDSDGLLNLSASLLNLLEARHPLIELGFAGHLLGLVGKLLNFHLLGHALHLLAVMHHLAHLRLFSRHFLGKDRAR